MMDTNVAPCPKCGQRNAKKINFTWWGGALGPRLSNHVKCNNCGTAYNGTTGNYNTMFIIMYTIAILVIGVVVFAVIFGGS
ncbi:MAG TPA: hypothetical protein VJZ27_01905 [Aggregatilineales bacterium]|nr:hypothetical protein [Aggregatilineales bacterium]